MTDRILELSRIAEDYARNHVRDCETYGYTMFEGTAEDEFHAEYRNKFAELIVNQCTDLVRDYDSSYVHGPSKVIRAHFGVE